MDRRGNVPGVGRVFHEHHQVGLRPQREVVVFSVNEFQSLVFRVGLKKIGFNLVHLEVRH